VFNDYRDDERKYHYNNIQTEIYDAFLKRIANEAKFLNQPEKRLTNSSNLILSSSTPSCASKRI